MLDLRVTMKGRRAVIGGLRDLRQRGAPEAISRGLGRVVREAFDEAFKLLSGPGRKKTRSRNHTRKGRTYGKTRARGQSDMPGGRPGSYPVPVLTGNLRRLLGFVEPGGSVTSNGETFSAGPDEAILYDSAEYADVIHEGEGSSARYGPRPFMADAVQRVDAAGILEAELEKETKGK